MRDTRHCVSDPLFARQRIDRRFGLDARHGAKVELRQPGGHAGRHDAGIGGDAKRRPGTQAQLSREPHGAESRVAAQLSERTVGVVVANANVRTRGCGPHEDNPVRPDPRPARADPPDALRCPHGPRVVVPGVDEDEVVPGSAHLVELAHPGKLHGDGPAGLAGGRPTPGPSWTTSAAATPSTRPRGQCASTSCSRPRSGPRT